LTSSGGIIEAYFCVLKGDLGDLLSRFLRFCWRGVVERVVVGLVVAEEEVGRGTARAEMPIEDFACRGISGVRPGTLSVL